MYIYCVGTPEGCVSVGIRVFLYFYIIPIVYVGTQEGCVSVGIRVFFGADVSPCLAAIHRVSHSIAILEVYASVESYCWMRTH